MRFILTITFLVFSFPAFALSCSRAPTVIDYSAEAAASPYYDDVTRTIHIDPDFFAQRSEGLQKFIFSHECGHAHGIISEFKADAYAVRIGKRQGWFTRAMVNEACGDLVSHGAADRCRRLRKALRD